MSRPATFDPISSRACGTGSHGAGLMMIGGYDSFGPGGWGNSPLAELLPVEMHVGDGQLNQPLRMVPTPAGLRHYILRLGGDRCATRRRGLAGPAAA